MFDPAKLSPLPWHFEEWADDVFDIDNVADNVAKDDAEFFLAARRCYDIGERRGWYVYPLFQSDNRWWTVCYLGQLGKSPAQLHRAVDCQAEAMALMIEADEWLTNNGDTEGEAT